MQEKVDAIYEPERKSRPTPKGLVFRLAKPEDAESLFRLMYLRNPKMEPDDLMARTKREISYNKTDERYRIFVAELDQKVVGLSRYYHGQGIKKEKTYPAPEGYYLMGTIVDPQMRRQSIARFLSESRLNYLREQKVKEVYSGVAGDNQASIRMHEQFGFERIKELKGFHHIPFDCGYGYLFKKSLGERS